jgi:hypothetical protein
MIQMIAGHLECQGGRKGKKLDLALADIKQGSIFRHEARMGNCVSKGSITNVKYFDLSWTLERSKKLSKQY